MQVAIELPVGDQDSARMLGTSTDGLVDSENRTGFRGLNAVGRKSFLSGRVAGFDMLRLWTSGEVHAEGIRNSPLVANQNLAARTCL